MKLARYIISEIIFWTHLPILIAWIGLFFVPLSIFPQRVEYHLYYYLIVYIIQFITGIFYYSTFGGLISLCPLTLIMQRIRGVPWKDPKNYEHSFTAEAWSRILGVKNKSRKSVSMIQNITLFLILVQYFFGFLVF